MIDNKMLKKITNLKEASQMLRVNLANSENIIRNIVKANQRKKLFTTINEWLNNIQAMQLDRIRETLYNIE